MRRNARLARIANAWMRLEGFLHHGAEQAGEIRQFALQTFGAQIDVSQHAITRVSEAVIRSLRKHAAGQRVPVVNAASAKSSLLLK